MRAVTATVGRATWACIGRSNSDGGTFVHDPSSRRDGESARTADCGPTARLATTRDSFAVVGERGVPWALWLMTTAPWCTGADAFATPTPVTSAPRQKTIERLARFTTFFFVVRYMEFLSDGQRVAAET